MHERGKLRKVLREEEVAGGGGGVTSVVGHCERRLSVDEARTPDRIGLCLTNSSSSESES